MVDGLAAFYAGIHNDSVAFVELDGAGKLRRDPLQVAEQRVVAGTGISHGGDVPAGDDEYMDWGHGMNVGEGVSELILENRDGGNDAFNDLAEEAAHSESSVHGRCCRGNEIAVRSVVRGFAGLIPSGDVFAMQKAERFRSVKMDLSVPPHSAHIGTSCCCRLNGNGL